MLVFNFYEKYYLNRHDFYAILFESLRLIAMLVFKSTRFLRKILLKLMRFKLSQFYFNLIDAILYCINLTPAYEGR